MVISRVRRPLVPAKPTPITQPITPELATAGYRSIPDALAAVPEVNGETIMDKATQEVTLDRFLDGNPKVINDEMAYFQLTELLRANRARDITAEAKRGKKGVKDDENEDSE